ncbi:MAG: hypothetical protein IGR93_01040 [Hydrococcus sp. C42_A2020_068]|uniref:hypothetical protein n=1 Tax=Pleurocapsa sp. PCC 7327 TaxID=118163 RepID=UPI00029F98B3|nr:hypothetical protein [Pleurocapsa sp. PCC 7327]AFY76481.1 hypothetical protein Ple7327_1067 [Pleurocapsa sp. PCC 7327]MBF2018719.1 hypothetical protein [Hydrococcus sp. C42_A2020_068]
MKQFQKIGRLGLVSVTFIGLTQFPVRSDTTAIQNGAQDANISGDNNQVTQIINQTIINHPGRGSLNRSDNKKDERAQAREFENRGNGNGVERNSGKGDRL